MTRKCSFYAFLLFSTVLLISCETGGAPDISVRIPRIVGTGDIAVFMLIINDGTGSDFLTGCSLKEYPKVRGEIHDVIDGVMNPIQELKIPANKYTVLEAGSLHLMFFGLPENLGDEITVFLQFRKSGTREVRIPVTTE